VNEIGERLTEWKRICDHGNWLLWLDREFGWTERTAQRYISVYELTTQQNVKYDTVSDFDIDVKSLYLLAAPSTPESAREAVLDLAANGEQLTHAKVREMIAEARAQQRAEARGKDRDGGGRCNFKTALAVARDCLAVVMHERQPRVRASLRQRVLDRDRFASREIAHRHLGIWFFCFLTPSSACRPRAVD
jgi:hypothetical protein